MDKIKHFRVVILAGGRGTRMKVEIPKVLVPLYDRPLIIHLLPEVHQSSIGQRPVIVVGFQANKVIESLGADYDYVYQPAQLGTGHAVQCCRPLLQGQAEHLMVLYGDHPLVTARTINQLVTEHLTSGAVLTMATVQVGDFNDWRKVFFDFGRVIRSPAGQLMKIVEKRDASDDQLQITEVNPAYFCFAAEWLWKNIDQLENHNAQQEFYLTDLLGMAFVQERKISTVTIDPQEALGVNTAEQLELVKQVLKKNNGL